MIFSGIVPASEPGGKDTKIAIATDSVLAPAKHHIASGQGEYE